MFFHIRRIVWSILIICMFSACSNSEEPTEKGHIEQTTDKIAQEAVQSMKAPIDKANLAKELTEQHNSAVEKNMNQQ